MASILRRGACARLRPGLRYPRLSSFRIRSFGSVNMEQLKKLRGVSGAPIKDCKKALEETEGDMDAALEWMRKQGTLVQGKRADQEASQGLVGLAFEGDDTAALLEISTETDSAARIDMFHTLMEGLAKSLLGEANNKQPLDRSSLEGLAWVSDEKSPTVGDAVAQAVVAIRENIFPRRGVRLSVPGGLVGGYVHNVLKTEVPDVRMGQIGVVVGLEGVPEGKLDDAKALAHKLAMHVAAAKPEFLGKEELSDEQRERQEKLLTDIAMQEGKPEHAIEKMVKGRMNKFYQETCLLEQTYLIYDGEGKAPAIKKLLKTEAERLGASEPLRITAFHSFRLGQ